VGLIQRALKRFPPANTFVKGAAALIGGTIGGQLIVLAVTPVLTRLYTPAMFGAFSVFLGFSVILGSMATLRYEVAIPQAEDDEAAANLVVLGLVLTLGTFVVSSMVLFIFRNWVVMTFDLGSAADLLWLVPGFILVTGGFRLLNYWNLRKRQFGTVAKSRIHKNLSMSLVQVLAFPFGALALLGGQLSGFLVAGFYLLFHSRAIFQQKISLESIKSNAYRFRKYPLFSTWSGVFGTAGNRAPMFLFAALFSSAVAGLYGLAFQVVNYPLTLVGTAVTNVFLPHAADAYIEGRLGALLSRVHMVLVRLAMPVALGAIVMAPAFFSIVFGPKWHEAGRYVQLLAPMLYANFIYSPVSQTYGILNRQDAGLLLHIGLFVTSLISIGLGALIFRNVLLSVAFYSVSQAVLYLWALCWFHRQAGNDYRALLAPVFKALVESIPAVAPLLVWVLLPAARWAIIPLALVSLFFAWRYYRPLVQLLLRPSAPEPLAG
jgi:O-antigen/teichoic acid export membrane protein